MCMYCDESSYECEIFHDEENDSYYLDIETGEWSDYYDEYLHQRIDINFCPYCGRELGKENPNNKIKEKLESFCKQAKEMAGERKMLPVQDVVDMIQQLMNYCDNDISTKMR